MALQIYSFHCRFGNYFSLFSDSFQLSRFCFFSRLFIFYHSQGSILS